MPIAKARPRSEFIMLLIQPLANRGVRLLARWHINPLLIVLSHACCGFLAALLIAWGRTDGVDKLVYAALLLQLKTLLDNMDGGLARATGQITLMGRYFDTGMDFLVNIALFLALSLHGSLFLSLLAFFVLTFILSFDYNAEKLYKQERQAVTAQAALPMGAPPYLFRIFKGLYDLILAPQDRLIVSFDRWLFKNLSGLEYETAKDLKSVWSDLFSTASLVNLGLSSQMLLLGLCLVLGKPYWYVYSIFLQALYVGLVQGIRSRRFAFSLRHRHG